ncbi:hypothetical protein [Mycoplana rhizolycopersici]|jgi:hypothetical protein|uniref:Uncharacterized protein n=1 Tax=Mycoplana rhizolycopersici TaxID=2746702 RepID=A0ABX2QEQ1_9HYPH|nr:hypothetical protein [Rhizobium rhizolycopersici]NVP54841.1 hypothetical protein [Rhizobium rhizolycopersici]
MSSNVQHVDFRMSDIRILQIMLKQAHYLTQNLRPLEGPHFLRSQMILGRFLTTILRVPVQ